MRNFIILLFCLCAWRHSARAQGLPDVPANKDTASDIPVEGNRAAFFRLKDSADVLMENHRYDAAIALFNQLLTQPLAPQKALVEVYIQLGQLYNLTGRKQLALQAHRACEEHCIALLKEEPGSVDHQYNLARAYNEIGKDLRDEGNIKGASEYLKQCNQIMQDLFEAHGDLSHIKSTLAISYCELALVEKIIGNLPSALALSKKGTQLMSELIELQPDDPKHKMGMANFLSEQGEMHRLMGEPNEALALFKESNQLTEALLNAHPSKVEYKDFLAHSALKLGETYYALDSLDASSRYFEQYNRLSKELHEAFPANAAFKQSLAISYQYLGHLLDLEKDAEKALVYFGQFNQLSQELCTDYPNNAFYKQMLATSFVRLADTHSALDKQEKALSMHELGLGIMKELYATYPYEISYKNSLAITYANLGFFCQHRLEDLEKAKGYYQGAERLWAELVRDAPQFAQGPFFLGHVREDLANLDAEQMKAIRQKIKAEPDRKIQYQQYGILCDTLRGRFAIDPENKAALAEALSSRAWCGFFLQHFEAGEADIREGLALAPETTFLAKNLAPALLLQGKTDDAMNAYQEWRDKPFGEGEKLHYRDLFLEDLLLLEKAGVIPPERKAAVATVRKLLKAK